ncbi:E2 ubiquitin-conjugating enzyme [Ramicandelaber brevisporus]|nr:E2 ubiquitin-conjugating enzyme [Ramicandelaber brevisporus]
MKKIWSVARNKEDAAKAKPKTTGAHLRIQKDLSEFEPPSTITIRHPDVNDFLNFEMVIKPDEGYYKGGVFPFSVSISNNYPHEPPKLRSLKTVYHPNLDLDGNVCLNILREDWKPVLNLTAVSIGMNYLFLEPNPDDPLNKEAAAELRADRNKFANLVRKTMAGASINDGHTYDNVLVK